MSERCIGKLPAVHDPRVKKLAHRMDMGAMPATPDRIAWHAELPADGIPMLGNNAAGCCVFASAFHFVQEIGLYNHKIITPTTDECLAEYSAVTGYNKDDPSTDNGTLVLGPGGLIEHWSTTGLMIGGELNKCGPVASVNWHDPAELQLAIATFGFVFVGANLTQADVDSDYLWLNWTAPSIGGHEFLVTGYVRLANTTRYDILTWNGMWRCDGDWLEKSVDEALVVFDASFLDAHGLSPGGIDVAALQSDALAFA